MTNCSNDDDFIKFKHNIFLTGHPSVGKTTIIINTINFIQDTFLKMKHDKTKTNTHSNRNRESFQIRIHGFYTEECRNSTGDRIGFDIVYWTDDDNDDNDHHAISNTNIRKSTKCVSLSRLVEKVKKSDPHVGKYLVNIENVKKYAIPSLDVTVTSNTYQCDAKEEEEGVDEANDRNIIDVIVIDEVGKMEMLCPEFLTTVNRILDQSSSLRRNRLLIGTIPTPRYGRVIPAIEDIRAREDVMVLHVTKDNRNQLQQKLCEDLMTYLSIQGGEPLEEVTNNCTDGQLDLKKSLSTFLYSRPIGASSLNGNKAKKETNDEKEISDRNLLPCGPLQSADVKPKILLLGETSSAKPFKSDLAYCERSMWTVLGSIFQMNYTPSTAEEVNLEEFINLKKTVLSNGICIWDVLSNVHDKSLNGGRQRKRKNRSGSTEEMKLNDIKYFLKENPTIQGLYFIGKKAHVTYVKLFKVENDYSQQSRELIVLPSSSKANSRMTKEEKATAWKDAFSRFITL
mmetsp:Transcript_14373/g.16321  ORF Transcript_14373/g.16321 Transcript_14373/m.16321 type:complete len:512 (-) Transcript_14373:662-2197(-)